MSVRIIDIPEYYIEMARGINHVPFGDLLIVYLCSGDPYARSILDRMSGDERIEELKEIWDKEVLKWKKGWYREEETRI